MYGAGMGVSEEERRLRVLRLLQVREQSKAIAKKIRDRVQEEKCKQTSQALTKRQIQIQNEKQALQDLCKRRLSSIGEGHNSAAAENYSENERLKEFNLKKKHYATKALQRSKGALATIHKDKEATKNISKNRRSQIETAGKNISSPNEIDQYYEEEEALKNYCGNFSIDKSDLITDEQFIKSHDNKEFHDSMSISPYPVKENSKKMQTHKSKPVDSPTVLDSQLTIADIEKALCDCEPHLKNVVSNVQNLLKNNGYVECDQTKSQANDDNYTTRSDFFEIASKIDRKKSPKSEMKKIEFVPITMISDYLKSREENKNPQSVIEDKINKHLLSCNTRDNSPFQKYSELEMEDVHKAGPSKLADDIPNLKKVDFSNLISRQKIVKGIPKTNSITSHKKIFVSGIDKMPLKNLHRSKRCRTKSPIKTISSISNRKYHSPFLNKRIVKCYDYNNKFCKNTYVNDDDLVERLSQKKVDAFQRAFEETEEKEATEKSLEATKARLNDLSRMRGEKALEKMKIENDYKNLLEELEFLTKRERLIRNRIPDEVLRPKVRNQDENDNNQRHANASVANILSDRSEFNITNTRFSSSKSKLKSKSSTNVANWDVCNESTLSSSQDKHTIDSESSIHSIILRETRQVNTVINHKQNVKDAEPPKSHKSKNKEKNLSKKTKKSADYSNENVIHKNFPVLSSKIPEIWSNNAIIENSNSTTVSNKSNRISATSSTVMFEGLEIKIQLKKSGKDFAKGKTFETKNKQVQTVTSEFESSSEISIKASRMETTKKKIVLKKNGTQKFDSSDSTTYMSPPEKMTTYIENYLKKNHKTSDNKKPRNAISNDKLDKSVNTDHSRNKTTDNILKDNNPHLNKPDFQEGKIISKPVDSALYHDKSVNTDHSRNNITDDILKDNNLHSNTPGFQEETIISKPVDSTLYHDKSVNMDHGRNKRTDNILKDNNPHLNKQDFQEGKIISKPVDSKLYLDKSVNTDHSRNNTTDDILKDNNLHSNTPGFQEGAIISKPVDSTLCHDKSMNMDHGRNKRTDNILKDNNPHLNKQEFQEGKIISKPVDSKLYHDQSAQVDFDSSDDSNKSSKVYKRQKRPKIEIQKLEGYIKKLLGMSEIEINQLNANISDVATPSSSTVNISSNLMSSDCFDNKLDKVQMYIKESYELLDQFKKINMSSNENKYKIGDQKKVRKKQPKQSSTEKTDSSNKYIKNGQNLKEKEIKINDRVEASDIQCPIENINKAGPSSLSCDGASINVNEMKNVIPDLNTDSSIDLQIPSGIKTVIDSMEININKIGDIEQPLYNNNLNELHSENAKSYTSVEDVKSDEKLDELNAEYVKRIENLSQQLVQVRNEKKLTSPTSDNVGESTSKNKEILKDTEFIPILSDIPNPSFQNDLQIDVSQEKIIDFYESNRFPTQSKEVLSNYPHDLSTIIEVDTPVTNKNLSALSKNIDIDIAAAKELFIDVSGDKTDIVAPKEPHINISNDKTDNEESSIFASNSDRRLQIPILEDSAVNVNIEPFVLLERYFQNIQSGRKNEKISASNESTYSSSPEESFSSMIASNKALLLKRIHVARQSRIDKSSKICEISGVCQMDSSSGSLTTEMENLIKSFGPEGMAIWKRTQESQALPSSTSSSMTQLDETKNDIIDKFIDVTDTSIGLSTLYDDLNLSVNHQKQFSILTDSLNKKLDSLHKKSAEENNRKKRDAGREIPTISNLTKDKNIVKDSTDCSPAAETADFQSKDKTQHRTSTPVQQSKLSSSSKTITFSVDSDLSSVKNVSNSISSDDRLSVPNVSLRFGKLFESSSSIQSNK